MKVTKNRSLTKQKIKLRQQYITTKQNKCFDTESYPEKMYEVIISAENFDYASSISRKERLTTTTKTINFLLNYTTAKLSIKK